eukprot:7864813-Ditylum_brightwellii.AAC.1
MDNFIPNKQEDDDVNAPDAGLDDDHLENDDIQPNMYEEMPTKDAINNTTIATTDEDTAGVPTVNNTITTSDEETAGVP